MRPLVVSAARTPSSVAVVSHNIWLIPFAGPCG